MRMTHVETGVMFRVLGNRGDTITSLHPMSGQIVEAPRHLYLPIRDGKI